MIQIFRYVRHGDVDAFMARGWWTVAPLGLPHGEFSVLMQACQCEAARECRAMEGTDW